MFPLVNKLARGLRRAVDPDRALQLAMSAAIESVALRYTLADEPVRWREGEPLKLLFAGYVGTRNTGADVRVEEMLRQFRHVLGEDAIEATVCSVDRSLSAGYFRRTKQLTLPPLFPKFLHDNCPNYHGVVACEGSMFKSKFADALSTFMAGALGMANAEGKLSIGYGGEAGAMSDSLRDFVRDKLRDSLIICRNAPSRDILEGLGVRTKLGTDTAWTFEPAPAERAEALLRAAGWDGQAPILAVCPINPFWWPVKPDLLKAAAWRVSGQYGPEHYKSIYFHRSGPDVSEKYERYIDELARAVGPFARERGLFTILVGMEKVDRRSCERLAARLSRRPPLFISDSYDMYDMVAVLRRCRMLVSSRYHAIVTSMGGLVPSAGVTMDERIRNLMNDRGDPDLFLEVDDPQLSDRLRGMLERLDRDGESIAAGIKRALPDQLRLMGQMGIDLQEELRRHHPEFPLPDLGEDPMCYLPPLPAELESLLTEVA